MERPSQGTRELGHAVLRAALGTGALGCPPACPALGQSHQKALGKGGAGAGRGKADWTAETREKPRGCGWGPAMIRSVFLCSFPPRFSPSSASSLLARWVKPVFSAWSSLPEGGSPQHCHLGGRPGRELPRSPGWQLPPPQWWFAKASGSSSIDNTHL